LYFRGAALRAAARLSEPPRFSRGNRAVSEIGVSEIASVSEIAFRK
jgi:hypothetical protein